MGGICLFARSCEMTEMHTGGPGHISVTSLTVVGGDLQQMVFQHICLLEDVFPKCTPSDLAHGILDQKRSYSPCPVDV